MGITLHKFGEAWGLSDPSPFCVKLESFLRLNDIAFQSIDFDPKTTFKKSPKKKVPFVILENGQLMGDSTLIIAHLSKERNIDMDKDLSKEQRTQSHAFRRMLDESFYFSALYSRWQDDIGWNAVKPFFFADSGMPKFLQDLFAEHIRKGVLKTIYLQGTGRHSQEEIYAHGTQDLQALSDLLGANQWFFGADKPGLLDLWAHAYVIEIIEPPIETVLKTNAFQMDNLVSHARRFQELVYGGVKTEAKKAA